MAVGTTTATVGIATSTIIGSSHGHHLLLHLLLPIRHHGEPQLITTRANERLRWNGIVIEVRYDADWLESYRENYGYPLAHLEIESAAPGEGAAADDRDRIPLMVPGDVEADGGRVQYVRRWLEHEARSDSWKSGHAERRQLTALLIYVLAIAARPARCGDAAQHTAKVGVTVTAPLIRRDTSSALFPRPFSGHGFGIIPAPGGFPPFRRPIARSLFKWQ